MISQNAWQFWALLSAVFAAMSQFQQGGKSIPFDAQVLSLIFSHCKPAQRLF